MTVPAISIIVPTHNRCEMLRQTLESLLAQNFRDIPHEVIVVDNNSNDRTREVVEEFVSANRSDFRYAFEPQEGIPYARNKGLAEARAPIIAFTDDDGFVDVDWAFQIKKNFDEHPEVSYLGGKVLGNWSQEPPAWLTEKHWSPLALADFGDEPFYVDLTNPICLITANFACRREIIEEVGPFSLEFLRCQDHELQLRIWKAGKRGMYRPELIVTAHVPEERLTKSYHRHWHRRHGFYMAKLRQEDFEQSRARFLDIPAAVYRRLITYSGRWLYNTISGNRDAAFTYETELSFFLGYFQNRIRSNITGSAGTPLSGMREAIAHTASTTATNGFIVARPPMVSVIIPTYNCAQFITDALNSVLAQRFTDYEIIVINDGSPDTEALEKALAPYMSRIVYLKQENRGVSGARNTAIAAARGSLIAFLDGDDTWLPHYLEVQVARIQADPTIDVLYPNVMMFGDSSRTAGEEFMTICPSNGEVTFERLLMQECNVSNCSIARRESIVRAGLYDESLRSVEDFDLWLRVIKQGGRIAYHRDVLARYRLRPGSLTADPIWSCGNILKVLAKVKNTMELTPSEQTTVDNQIQHFKALLRFHEGKRSFLSGDTASAIKALTEANSFFRNRKLSMTVMILRVAPRLLLRAYNLRDRLYFRTVTKY